MEPKYHPLTRPNIVEKESVSRLADITKLSNSKSYVVHLSCRESLETVKMAREKNIDMDSRNMPTVSIIRRQFI
ncbi:hypothetical protein BM530_19610 [Clostridioides difficile]|nr:hypothetical protein BM530_19610 [Clostridioides difficile]